MCRLTPGASPSQVPKALAPVRTSWACRDATETTANRRLTGTADARMIRTSGKSTSLSGGTAAQKNCPEQARRDYRCALIVTSPLRREPPKPENRSAALSRPQRPVLLRPSASTCLLHVVVDRRHPRARHGIGSNVGNASSPSRFPFPRRRDSSRGWSGVPQRAGSPGSQRQFEFGAEIRHNRSGRVRPR